MARLPVLIPGDAGLLTRLALVAPAWLILLTALLTPTSALLPDQGDVRLYYRTGGALVSGEIPYRDFAFFYPPAALIPMAVPFIGGILGKVDLTTFKLLFAVWQAVLMLVLGLILARIAERVSTERVVGDGGEAGVTPDPGGDVQQVLLRLALLSVGAVLALTWRYDLFPAVLVMAATWAAIDRRPAWVGVLVGIGVLAKLYPIAVLAALAVPWLVPFDLSRLVRLGGSLGVTVIAGLLPFIALAGRRAVSFFEYQVGHGIQIESLGGGLAALAGVIAGAPLPMSFANSRVQVEGPLAEGWLAIVPVLTVTGFGLLALAGWRRIRRDAAAVPHTIDARTIVALAGASVMMVLVTSKTFSIQYVVWLLPFMAFLRGPRFVLAVGIAALTIPIHPLLYAELVNQQALPVVLANLRNGLLVVLTAWAVWELGGRPAGPRRPAIAAGT